MSTTVLVILSTVCACGCRLFRYWLRLRFLRHAFDRSGDRNDLEVAGKVTAPGWRAHGDWGLKPQGDQGPAAVNLAGTAASTRAAPKDHQL